MASGCVGKLTSGQLDRYREQFAYYQLALHSQTVEFEMEEAVTILRDTWSMESELLEKHDLDLEETYTICPVTGAIFAVEMVD